ncbi:uncharacterized protein PV07_06189 [Cladophialophora immunda]|uniref:F-box domain-containing protein n=1 Tax=Cladophialophora immunda TaxID=569365 RepID=A0A0D2AYT9_9EURO|nr:uncharacterized protein PV07_06189 [Cladophialophora immunda]KIW30447.1 hypothetical protein PV07_06189 [Cladophialophora immunda]
MARVSISVRGGFARPRRRHVPPNAFSGPRVIRRHEKFAVPHRILFSGRTRRRRQIRAQNASSNPKLTLCTLPVELQLKIMDHLDKPSRIALGLTSKHFADVTRLSKTDLTDRPCLVRWCTPGPCSERRYTQHISDRRILMLQLKTWFPRSQRLCWVCLKYTPIKGHKWHFTARVNTLDGNHIDLAFLNKRPVTRVWAHARCMNLNGLTNGRDLGKWAVRTAGAAGGLDTYHTVFSGRLRPAGLEVYEH